MTTTTKELIEKLSDYMHNVWSNWYLYQRKFTNKENEIRWSNQSITKYKNLSEEDKEKDRKFAREILKIIEKHLQELPQPNIEYLKEEITPRESMVEYLEGEKIIRPQYQKKYKTKQEVKAYNDGIKTSIQMIGSCRTMLKELPQQEVETYEQGLEDGRKEVFDKVEELISKIKILEITGLPLSYKIILEQLQSLLPTNKDEQTTK